MKNLLFLILISISSFNNSYANGTGVVISNNGYILTNAHVSNNDGETPTIQSFTFILNGKYYPAEFVFSAHNIDLALYKIDNVNLPCSIIGNEDPVKGQTLFIKMYPFFQLDYSNMINKLPILYRIHDQKDNIQVKYNIPVDPIPIGFLFENIIRPGNSGSPIFNDKGYIVGIAFAAELSDNNKISYGSYSLYSHDINSFFHQVNRLISCSPANDNTVGWLFQ